MAGLKEEKFTPEEVIAGAVPYVEGNPREIAYHAASYALDTERVHLVCSQHDGMVYYLASPSSEFANMPLSSTPLGSALPGGKGHQGDGIYTLNLGHSVFVVVVQEQTLRSYVGDPVEVKGFTSDIDLPVYSLDGGEHLSSWDGYRLMEIREDRRIARSVTAFGVLASFLGLALWIVLVMANSWLSSNVSDRYVEARKNADQISRELATVDPLAVHLNELQRITSVAVKAKGWVGFYRLRKGQVSWEVDMPSWVTEDYIKALGGGVRAVKNEKDGTITFIKGNRE